jgi:hypothetical protein
MEKLCRNDRCKKPLPANARPDQDFCSNSGKCRSQWHQDHNKAISGVRGKIRSIRPVTGDEVSITVRVPAAEKGRALNLKQGQEIGLVE